VVATDVDVRSLPEQQVSQLIGSGIQFLSNFVFFVLLPLAMIGFFFFYIFASQLHNVHVVDQHIVRSFDLTQSFSDALSASLHVWQNSVVTCDTCKHVSTPGKEALDDS
jgi:hypothetical protein